MAGSVVPAKGHWYGVIGPRIDAAFVILMKEHVGK